MCKDYMFATALFFNFLGAYNTSRNDDMENYDHKYCIN